MTDRSRRKKRPANEAPSLEQPVSAIEVRGERFAIVPAPGYEATVILLAEYLAWLNALKDQTARARVAYNVGKLARGLMGDWKEVGGVYEMRIDYGSGTAYTLANMARLCSWLLWPAIRQPSRPILRQH